MIGDRRWCPKCRRSRTVTDEHVEADHGLSDAMEWGVSDLDCGHHLEGSPRLAVNEL